VKMLKVMVAGELLILSAKRKIHHAVGDFISEDRGDVPGWVLVVLMTTGLVTGIWTLAAPKLSSLLNDSLNSMNGIR